MDAIYFDILPKELIISILVHVDYESEDFLNLFKLRNINIDKILIDYYFWKHLIDLQMPRLNARNKSLEKITPGDSTTLYYMNVYRQMRKTYELMTKIYNIIYDELKNLKNKEFYKNRIILANTDDPITLTNPHIYYGAYITDDEIFVDITNVRIDPYYVLLSNIEEVDSYVFASNYLLEKRMNLDVMIQNDHIFDINIFHHNGDVIKFKLNENEFTNFLYDILKNN